MSSQDSPATAVGKAATDAVDVKPVADLGQWILLGVGLVLLQAGAYYTVQSVGRLSEILEIATGILSASLVALGTSLPELSVSIRSAQSGRAELAVGNVIGSNIFNALAVVGGSALFGTVVVSPPVLQFVIPVMIGATVLCFFVLQEGEMTRWDGWLLLILFFAYTVQLYRL
jgi:cation:H+ antiporter